MHEILSQESAEWAVAWEGRTLVKLVAPGRANTRGRVFRLTDQPTGPRGMATALAGYLAYVTTISVPLSLAFMGLYPLEAMHEGVSYRTVTLSLYV